MPDTYLKQQLMARQVSLFHAMNLRGLDAYCQSGAVVARAQLMQDPLHTRFWSDPADQQLGVLGRVFGNVYDFGAIAARAPNSVPNIYGPIALKFRPAVFGTLADVVATPKSIATLRAAWRSHAILSNAEVDALLAGDSFGYPVASSFHYTEVSCANPAISFDLLEEVLVDDITVCGVSLLQEVQQRLARCAPNVPALARRYSRAANLQRLQQIATSFDNFQPNPARIHQGLVFTQPPPWLAGAPQWVQPRLQMWLSYFYNGTVAYLRGH